MEPVRRAVIDIGTNSVKLLVAEIRAGVVTPLLENSEQTRLGKGFYLEHRLQPEAIAHTARAVRDFAAGARELKANDVRVIATSAARDATNAQELTDAVRQSSGLGVQIISGEQEADWAFQGVLTTPDLTAQALLILDVGGGSAEFILGQGKEALFQQSFPLGTVRTMEKLPLSSDPPTAGDWAHCHEYLAGKIDQEIKPQLAPILTSLGTQRVQLVGTGGTTTILARMENQMTDYDRARIDATRISRARIHALRQQLWALSLEERKKIIGLPPNRADVILFGIAIYDAIMTHLDFNELRISARGMRYAALLEPL